MTFSVAVHPEAVLELDVAIGGYEQGGVERGDRFRSAYDAAVERIRMWPESGSVYPADYGDIVVRQVKIGHSSFWAVHYVEDETVNIVAVAHERRKPGYWKDRLLDGMT